MKVILLYSTVIAVHCVKKMEKQLTVVCVRAHVCVRVFRCFERTCLSGQMFIPVRNHKKAEFLVSNVLLLVHFYTCVRVH